MPSLSLKNEKTHTHWGILSTYRAELMGFACLWVMMHHNFLQWPAWAAPLRIFMRYGNCGVDIFFLLSGISLFYSLHSENNIKRFYRRRFFRIALPYVTICLPFWLWKDVFLQKGSFWLDFAFISFPLHKIITFWYIPTIACFYLISPFLFTALKKYENSLGIGIALAAFVFISALVLKKLIPTIYNHIEIGWLRGGIFIIGLSLGPKVYSKEKMPSFSTLYGVLMILFAFLFTKSLNPPNYWWRFSFIFIALGVTILLCATLDRVSCDTLNRLLRFFGCHSIELYLLHVALWKVWELTPSLHLPYDTHNLIQNLCAVLTSCFLAALLHPLLDRTLKLLTR